MLSEKAYALGVLGEAESLLPCFPLPSRVESLHVGAFLPSMSLQTTVQLPTRTKHFCTATRLTSSPNSIPQDVSEVHAHFCSFIVTFSICAVSYILICFTFCLLICPKGVLVTQQAAGQSSNSYSLLLTSVGTTRKEGLKGLTKTMAVSPTPTPTDPVSAVQSSQPKGK